MIGARGESLEALQLLINQTVSKKVGEEGFKRILIDVEGWKKQKEEELIRDAQSWGKQVLETGKELELEPQAPWQRRIIHMVVGEMKGLMTESVGEGRERHVLIRPASQKKSADKSEKDSKVKSEES